MPDARLCAFFRIGVVFNYLLKNMTNLVNVENLIHERTHNLVKMLVYVI